MTDRALISSEECKDGAALRRLRIVSLTCAYPNPLQPTIGVFVERRLQALSSIADVQVVSPVAIFRYGSPAGARIGIGEDKCPFQRQNGAVTVLHPRWFYPPLSGGLTAGWLALRMISYLRRLRRTVPFDILDTHFGHPDGIAGGLISRALGVPFTMTLRGNEPAHARSRLVHRSLAWALSKAARVFTVSERLRQFAIGLGANPDKVKTIPNGVDTSIFHPGERMAIRVQNGLDPQKPLIVSAGALIERKGHHRIVRGVGALNRSARGPVQLAIVGGAGPEGAYEREIRQTIAALHLEADVRLVGSVSGPEMARWMAAADVLCLASTREGWPNVVNEALACGTPVVATDVGAVPDMLPDTRYGFVVPVNDEAALGGALDQALRKEWDRSAIAAWGQRRSWGHVAQDVLEEMHSVIAGAKGMERFT